MKRTTLIPVAGLVLATGLALVAPSGPAAAAPRASAVKASSPDPSVLVGTSAVIQGQVSPAAARRVSIQRLDGTRWVTTKTVTADARGRYTATVTSTTVQSATYRASVGASSTYTAGVSPAVRYSFVGRGVSTHRSFLGGTRARWDRCDPVTYRVNLTNATAAHLNEVKVAVGRIATQSGLTFSYLGTTTAVPQGRLNPAGTDIVVAFSKPGQTTLLPTTNAPAGVGGASWSFNGVENQLSNGFVVINVAALSGMAAGFGTGPEYGVQGTRGQLLMHELGHAVGMGHAPSTDAAKPQLMYPVMTRKLAVWGAGDAKNLRELGGAGCVAARPFAARAASTPRLVVSR